MTVSLGGDLIVAIGGERVRSAADIARILISDYLPGDRIELRVVREGRKRVIQVVLGERPLEPRE